MLDRPAEAVAGVLRRLLKPGPVEDVLSGTVIGHPMHAALVQLPIGAWATTSLLDLTGTDARSTRRVQAIGIVAAVPTALAGASDWLSTAGAERRIGLVHAAANAGALGLHIAGWTARRRERRARAALLTLAGTGLVGVGGWLGGHLSYALGVGVDTTAFQHLPQEWTDVAAESDVPAAGVTGAQADGVPIMLARQDGRIVAYAARCTHRGGPLTDGEVRDGCVTCPWHGSVFALADGSVVSGPAHRPQPPLEVDVRAGRVLVRNDDERTLRKNPVGP